MTPATPYDEELRAAGLDPEAIRAQVAQALAEDLPAGFAEGDVTSVATIAADARGIGVLAAREGGGVAGFGVYIIQIISSRRRRYF